LKKPTFIGFLLFGGLANLRICFKQDKNGSPFSNTIRLKVSEAKSQNVGVSLMDASGRTMLQHNFVPETNQHQEEFQVTNLAYGMYFLRINTENKNKTLKVVKVE